MSVFILTVWEGRSPMGDTPARLKRIEGVFMDMDDLMKYKEAHPLDYHSDYSVFESELL